MELYSEDGDSISDEDVHSACDERRRELEIALENVLDLYTELTTWKDRNNWDDPETDAIINAARALIH